LNGRIAIVTGAGSGIGRAIAVELAGQGAAVAILDVNAERATETSRDVGAAGGQAMALECDVSEAGSVTAAVAAVTNSLGVPTVVANNAGILDDFLPALDTDEVLWNGVLAVNLTGMFHMTRATLPGMIQQGYGVFVNMASGAGLVAGMGGTAYTTSKHGVIGFTKQVALDYGKQGIRANAICPGSIDTELSRTFLQDNPGVQKIVDSVPAGRQGKAREIGKLASFLAGDDSAFMTGASVVIDGGWTIR